MQQLFFYLCPFLLLKIRNEYVILTNENRK